MNRIKRQAYRKGRAAFTLFEMIIVLTIIALLAGFVIFNLVGFTSIGEKQKVAGDIDAFRTSLALYHLQNGALPTTEQGLASLSTRPNKEPIPEHWQSVLSDVPLDPWGHPYQYRNPGKHNPNGFDVFSMGPDGVPDTDDDIGNWKSTPGSGSPSPGSN